MGCIAEKKADGNSIAIYKSVLQGKEAGKLYCNIEVCSGKIVLQYLYCIVT